MVGGELRCQGRDGLSAQNCLYRGIQEWYAQNSKDTGLSTVGLVFRKGGISQFEGEGVDVLEQV